MLDSGAAHERPRVLGIYCHFPGMSHLVAAELMNYFITSNFILILSLLNFLIQFVLLHMLSFCPLHRKCKLSQLKLCENGPWQLESRFPSVTQ